MSALPNRPTQFPTPKPEWLRPEQAAQLAGVSRALIYDWMKRGFIKNASIRPRGQVRGTRLVSVDSLLAFIESHAQEGPPSAVSEPTDVERAFADAELLPL